VLCEHCHPPDEGTPWWKPGMDYLRVDSMKDYFGGSPNTSERL
jgi:hypothetical protein